MDRRAGSGGAHTSRTMMLNDLRLLLSAAPDAATKTDYRQAVLEDNVLGKRSISSRQRSFRYLGELYGLDTAKAPFCALRRIWQHDPDAQPLIALASALVRDPALRGTAPAVLGAPVGALITADDLAAAITEAYPSSYSDATAHKIGRNAGSTWTQSGHLAGRTKKTRTRTNPRPASVAYALFLASLAGREGDLLFDVLPVEALDAPKHVLKELARDASRRDARGRRQVASVHDAWLLPESNAGQGRVIGVASVATRARELAVPVRFGERELPIGLDLEIELLLPHGAGVELAPLIPKLRESFPNPRAWSSRLRRALVPVSPRDAATLERFFRNSCAPTVQVGGTYATR